MTSPSSPIAFKEAQHICDALASGRQSILLRKGGIHEGRQGFSFAHQAFFLFPTLYHDPTASNPQQPSELVRVTHHAEAQWAITLTDWEKVEAIQSLHVYPQETVLDRFAWENKTMRAGSIHLALVRVYQLAEPWEFPRQKEFGGCRSWIQLPEPPTNWRETSQPVLDDSAFESLANRLAPLH